MKTILVHTQFPFRLLGYSRLIMSVDSTKQAHPCVLANGAVKELRNKMPHHLRNHTLTQPTFVLKPENSQFQQVLIVVDRQACSFPSLVSTCLEAAAAAGMASVVLPAGLRMGIMAPTGQNYEQGVDELLKGIGQAKAMPPEIHLFFPYVEAIGYLRAKLEAGQQAIAA